MTQSSNAVAESFLLKELAEIIRKVERLNQDKAAVERLIVRVRGGNEILKKSEVTRKNSINRVLVESIILEYVRAADSPVASYDIYRNLQKVIFNLNDNTFRSCLHRMKSRGLIKSPKAGRWEIS